MTVPNPAYQFAFAMYQDVTIKANGIVGKVVARWNTQAGQDQFVVEYVDAQKVIRSASFIAPELL